MSHVFAAHDGGDRVSSVTDLFPGVACCLQAKAGSAEGVNGSSGVEEAVAELKRLKQRLQVNQLPGLA